jgi:succinyl-diaminopimelate desuccinylase
MNAVALTQELVRIDTINPTSPERPCAERVGKLLEEAGFAVALHEFAPGRTSVVAKLGGGPGAPLCLAGHLDTVPLGAAPWKRAPFGELDGGKLYGRGSSDMKSGIAAMVAAALQLAKTPLRKAGLTLVLVAGEETGCEGAAHLATVPGALGRAGALIVGEPTGNRTVVGHKGALWLRARTRGVTAHGSMPSMGVNAVVKAARAVLALSEVRFTETDPLLGGATLNVGTIKGGLNINSVPDEAVIGIDIRTVPAQRHAEVRRRIAALLGPEVEPLETVIDLEGVRTAEDHPLVKSALLAAAAVTGEPQTPGAATYFTDASVLTPAYGGIPTVVLGPGEMALCHQTDEHCRTDRVEQAVEIYLRMARDWCGA